jgi:Flp pilus assembly protein TadG
MDRPRAALGRSGRHRAFWSGRQRERGSATVEFAMAMPLVLVMALALVQIGLLVKDQLVIVESARAGAREASVNGDDEAARRAASEAAASLDQESLEVEVERGGGAGSSVVVEVTYHAPVAIPLVAWLFPNRIDLSADATMRQETG